MYVYVENAANPAVRFQVMEFDKETGMGKLKGGYGAIITRKINKEELIKRGYKMVKSDVELPLTPRPAAQAKPAAEEE